MFEYDRPKVRDWVDACARGFLPNELCDLAGHVPDGELVRWEDEEGRSALITRGRCARCGDTIWH